MTKEIKDWGCPDWRDADAYIDSLFFTNTQWKWAFLRRLPVYRKEFDEIKSREDCSPSDDYTIEDWEDYKWIFSNFSLAEKVDPRTIPKTILFHAFGGTRVEYPGAKTFLKRFLENESFGVVSLRDLYLNLLKFLILDGITVPEPDEDDRPEMIKKIISIRFDLSKPLNRQLADAKLTLKTEADRLEAKFPKPKLFGKVRKNWPLYLRVIDAKDQGATDMEVFRQLLGDLEKTDVDLYDQMNVHQEAVLIHDWKEAGRNTMKNAAYYV